ncbi:MAG TPA: nitronate monooxygenase [Candidatus Kapabacteria bacterium]|nr:nitronate monooxygenase [Candidatus Kapabacteria bacterium]
MNAINIGNLNISLPIFQGGMGVCVSLSGLASAVANEGGVGVISAAGIGMNEPDYNTNFREANKRALRNEIQKARKLTKGVLGLNIMLALTDHEELIQVALDEKIDILIMGAGLPLKIPAMISSSGRDGHKTKLLVKVSSAKAAKLIFQYWANKYGYVPDAVVVEGPMAGGHLGFKKEELTGKLVPLHILVEETIREISIFENQFSKEIPVIAAGGIYSGKDIYEIMQYGAKAVKMGTRFVTTNECDASIDFKETYLACKKEDISIINSPVGLPGRVIKNDFVNQIHAGKTHPFKCIWHCLGSCNYLTAPYCIAQVLHNSAKGRMNAGFAFAGTNAYLAEKIISVKETFNQIKEEYFQEKERIELLSAQIRA